MVVTEEIGVDEADTLDVAVESFEECCIPAVKVVVPRVQDPVAVALDVPSEGVVDIVAVADLWIGR